MAGVGRSLKVSKCFQPVQDLSSSPLDFHTVGFLSRHNCKMFFVLHRPMCLGQIQIL